MANSLTMYSDKTNYPIVLFVYIFSFFLQQYYLDGYFFSLKPFMIVGLLLLLHLIWMIINKNQKITIKVSNYEVAMIFFFMYSFATIGFAKYKNTGIRFALGMVLYFFMYVIGKLVLQRYSIKQLEKIITHTGIAFNTVSLVLYIIGLYFAEPLDDVKQRVLGLMIERNNYRLIGTIEDPNFFVLFNTIFFFYYLTRPRNRINNIGLILCSITILLSLSRGGFFAIVFPLLFYVKKYYKRVNYKKIVLIILAVITLNIILAYILDFNYIRVFTIRLLNIFSDGGSGRINLWKNGLEVFGENPLFGIGINNFRSYNINIYGDSRYLHNTYLQILVETGIVGFSIFLVFVYLFLFRLLKLYRINKDQFLLFVGVSASLSLFNLSSLLNEALLLYMVICSRYLLEYSEKRDEDKVCIIN